MKTITLSPSLGNVAHILSLLALVAAQLVTASSPASPAIARIFALRLGYTTLQRAWQAFVVFEDEARYSEAAYLTDDVETMRNRLAAAGAELVRLEASLVGLPAPNPRLAKTHGARALEVAL